MPHALKSKLILTIGMLFLALIVPACNHHDHGGDNIDETAAETMAPSSEVLSDEEATTATTAASTEMPPEFAEYEVFIGGQEGYDVYRIPAIIETASGALLAFCEGRRSIADTGDIDLILKKSLDGGRTWSKPRIVVDYGRDTAGNPAPVLDRTSGDILLPFCTNPANDENNRRVWLSRSRDEGETWLDPVEITAAVKPREWTWYATGPGRSIQLATGRFVVPCDHTEAVSGATSAHIIYSDDGQEWKLGGSIGPDSDESQVAELADGRIVFNARDLSDEHRRWVAYSPDQGLTWSEAIHDPELPDPSCMASLLNTPDGLLYSGPASEKQLIRRDVTVRLSHDGGQSWPISKVLHPGGSAYSALARLPDGNLGCLYENGIAPFLPYQRITFAVFSWAWLEQ